LRFCNPIHEQLNVNSTQAAMSNVRVLHHGYVDPETLKKKEARNLAIALQMPDSPHAFHCRARAAFSSENWEAVVAAAEQLSLLRSAPQTAVEGCTLGGVAALRMGCEEAARRFLERAEQLQPAAPDVCLLRLLLAAFAYDESLKYGDMTSDCTILRAPMFWHDRRFSQALVGQLLGTSPHLTSVMEMSQEESKDSDAVHLAAGPCTE